jgi:PAT family beta-lactamase induction signal transducer AmpG
VPATPEPPEGPGPDGTPLAPVPLALRRKLGWVAFLYLAEGFPFGMVIYTLPVYLKDSGVSNQTIGALSLLALPWSAKVLWSPLVDRWPDYRRWIAACLVGLAVLFLLLPAFDPASPGRGLLGLLVLMAIVGATSDIAIDAYTIRLVNAGEEGEVNGVRVAAYRVALILSGALFLSQKTALGYPALFRLAGVFLLALAAVVWLAPRGAARWERGREGFRRILAGVWAWLAQPGSLGVICFILLYNLGDIAIAPMIRPFWMDSGYEVEEIGWISLGLGIGMTIVGALVGGVIVSRIGIFRGLWTLGLTQGFSNLGYAGAAYWGWGRPGLYASSIVESFTDGLGSAALLAFTMRLCEKEWAATQYAFLSAVFALTRAIFGAPTGYAAATMGYAGWFLTTFFLSFPVFAFLPAVRTRLAGIGARA